MEEAKKGKVINLTNINSAPAKDGSGKIFYQFSIVFEDGVSGIMWTTSQDGSPWKVGEEKEYTLEHDSVKNINKIKAVRTGGGGGGYGAKYKKNEKLDCASYSLSYAKDLAVDKVIPKEEILPRAEEFFAWLVAKGGVE
jgi:hypothetical protein